jgi:hypothetical protein
MHNQIIDKEVRHRHEFMKCHPHSAVHRGPIAMMYIPGVPRIDLWPIDAIWGASGISSEISDSIKRPRHHTSYTQRFRDCACLSLCWTRWSSSCHSQQQFIIVKAMPQNHTHMAYRNHHTRGNHSNQPARGSIHVLMKTQGRERRLYKSIMAKNKRENRCKQTLWRSCVCRAAAAPIVLERLWCVLWW